MQRILLQFVFGNLFSLKKKKKKALFCSCQTVTNYYDFQHFCHSILMGPSEGYDQLQPIIRAKHVSEQYMSAILYTKQIHIIHLDIASKKNMKHK